ncbi:MAG: hypothetical protein LQ342_004987 [Letrouitia transgressa]|nr:MAG: hypothetical protein LQ342_004987 [Letrouitia transgressa]
MATSLASSLAGSPPASPPATRPKSAIFQTHRSSSRVSLSSKQGGSSRASDDDNKTLVKVGFDLIPQRFQRSMVHVSSPTNLAVESPQGRKLFVFDKVFGEDVYQEGVWEYLNDSVNSFVQGYNVSILAYGQSGSGKSYTMGTSGPIEQNDSRLMGIIPRAASALFRQLAGPPPLRRHGSSSLRAPTRYSTASPPSIPYLDQKATGNENWQLKATYVEIYNEQLRDLLVPENIPQSERATVAIREDIKGRIILTGLNQVSINTVEDLLNALNFGSSIRQTDATAINAKSSRSHAVFSLNLVQRQNKAKPMQEKRLSMPIESLGTDNWVTIDSKLHFVDLAGSERLKNTQASGDRAKEGISINAGLASLGKVISQLSSRQAGSHVSYRDSKLTRLLQDSLGGNAITYLIACITPAEFHLSETLNTVQYAQRARAIQSKPQIQQVSDDNDKQATIERLRAEITFLRGQIQSAGRNDRRNNFSQEKTERQTETEIDLQNHLLDVQESYTALSQRHAKLISEITKARDEGGGDTPTLSQAIGDSAVERLKRSNSFAEAVEQVVLEYEKTIQALELSLSRTRSSLATTESSLLERESNCAQTEAINQHLQNRLKKLIDREASTENYLHDLEAKLDGHTSGEEKNSVLISELRREISRIRENEASCEDYISTLEERLAEADQDIELMQREVDRLEHVVERQRSLGKLDNLLYEFDHLQQNRKPRTQKEDMQPLVNGVSNTARKSSSASELTLQEAAETAIPDSDDDDLERAPSEITGSQETELGIKGPLKQKPKSREVKFTNPKATAHVDSPGQSPAQTNVVADKLKNVTQELFDLKVEHEATVTEFEMMSAKYEETLRKLADLQDAVDEARYRAPSQNISTPASTRPSSFLGPPRVNELKDGHLSSSHSLSSELSSAGASISTPSSNEALPDQTLSEDLKQLPQSDEMLVQELQRSRAREREKDQMITSLKDQYSETLDVVEELKTEVHKARMYSPTTPTEPVIRRKSSQNVMTIDRAHRSLASLKNIAVENLEDKPDTMQNFELNLNTAMHELHQRSERVQVLEAELASVKKEMEGKVAMISGLTRERSSLKASSPMDISVVSSMHEKLLQSENEAKKMQETHANREAELVQEIDFLQKSLESLQSTGSGMPGVFPLTPAAINVNGKQLGDRDEEIARLQDEVDEWQQKHKAAVDSMHASEQKLETTVLELEASMASVEARRHKRWREPDGAIEEDRTQQSVTVHTLQEEIDEHKATIQKHVSKLSKLERTHTAMREQLEEASRHKLLTEQQLTSHRDQNSKLSESIEKLQSDIKFHKHGLKSLHDTNNQALEDLRSKLTEEAADIARTKDNLIMEHQYAFTAEVTALNAKIENLSTQLEETRNKNDQAEREQVKIAASLENTSAELSRIKEEKETASRIVNELEDQLMQSYDQHKVTSSRLSVLNANRDQALNEALAAKTKLEEDLESYRRQLDQVEVGVLNSSSTDGLLNCIKGQLRGSTGQQPYERSNSLTSNLRKSGSATSLPSPPPAIPLPPLPGQAAANTPAAVNAPNSAATSPVSAHEFVSVQYAEDQEARIRTIEKHLFAEKQLTATLEEALVDLEHQGNKTKGDLEAWKKKCWAVEDELNSFKKERNNIRHSVQAVEEERNARREAEAARAHLQERMNALQKKKKKPGFNCF